MFIIHEDNSMEIIRGDSGIFTVELTDSEDVPYEVQEGDQIIFTVKENTSSEDPLIQKRGQVIEIEPEDTQDLEYGKYVYDVQFIYESGFTDTIIPPSPFIVDEEVTF